MGGLRSGAACDDMDIVSGPQKIPMPAKVLATDSLEAVAGNGRPDLFGNGYAETGFGVPAAVIDEYEMPAEQAFSAIAELQKFGAFA